MLLWELLTFYFTSWSGCAGLKLGGPKIGWDGTF